MNRADFTEWIRKHNSKLYGQFTTVTEGYLVIHYDRYEQIVTVSLDERAPRFSRWPAELTVTYSLN